MAFEFLESSTLKAGLNLFFDFFQLKDMLKLCLNVNQSQPTYAYKYFAYEKRV